MPKITEAKISLIKDLYIIDNKNLTQIACEVGVSRPSVRKILRKENLRNVKKEEYDFSEFINFSLFDQVNDEKSAYFLGLMLADGNNYIGSSKRKYYAISITLQERDVEMLKKLQKELAPKHTLYKIKTKETQQDCYRLNITSKKLSDQLIKLGCTPNKSHNLFFPNHIPNNLMSHFVRGYFDGDGSVGIYDVKRFSNPQNKYVYYKSQKVSFSGTTNFCCKLSDILIKKLGVKTYSYLRKNKITTEISINRKKDILIFKDWIYKGANLFFERKKKIFDAI